MLGIIALCESEQVELLSSEVLIYEGERNPLAIRREHTIAILTKAKVVLPITDDVRMRAEELTPYGIMPLDALHIAMAEAGDADYFCTCDDKLMGNALKVDDLLVKIINPIDLIREIEK